MSHMKTKANLFNNFFYRKLQDKEEDIFNLYFNTNYVYNLRYLSIDQTQPMHRHDLAYCKNCINNFLAGIKVISFKEIRNCSNFTAIT